jgi:hypothetical protein
MERGGETADTGEVTCVLRWRNHAQTDRQHEDNPKTNLG